MKYNKRSKTKLKLFLRSLGMLCKKPITPKSRIRVSKTILPDGSEIHHPPNIISVPMNQNSFASELHIYHETRKSLNKSTNQK